MDDNLYTLNGLLVEPLNPSMLATNGKFKVDGITRQKLIGKFLSYAILQKHEIVRLNNYLKKKINEEDQDKVNLLIKDR